MMNDDYDYSLGWSGGLSVNLMHQLVIVWEGERENKKRKSITRIIVSGDDDEDLSFFVFSLTFNYLSIWFIWHLTSLSLSLFVYIFCYNMAYSTKYLIIFNISLVWTWIRMWLILLIIQNISLLCVCLCFRDYYLYFSSFIHWIKLHSLLLLKNSSFWQYNTLESVYEIECEKSTFFLINTNTHTHTHTHHTPVCLYRFNMCFKL